MSPKKKAKEKAKKKEVAPHSEAGVGGAAQPVDGAMEASPAWERGTEVQLFGLAGRPELNETAGVVVQFDEPRGRYAVIVELLDSKPILIKPTNLRPWPPAGSAGVSAAVEPAALPPLALSVSIEGSLAPHKDTQRTKSAPIASPPTANMASPSRRASAARPRFTAGGLVRPRTGGRDTSSFV